MNSTLHRTLALIGLVGTLGCAEGALTPDESSGPSGKLTLTGSSTIAPAISDLAKLFESRHEQVRIDVQTGGSSRGIRDATAGLADIGMSSRSLRPEELEEVQTVTFAQDGVCFLLHASNSVDEISDQDLRAIYTGQLRSWKELGGPDLPITVINRAEGRSELSLVSEYLGIAPDQFVADVIAGENQQGIKQVASDPTAIVYMSVGTSEYEVGAGTPIKILPLRGVEASSETVGSGRYPLARPLVLITQPEREPLVADFLDFVCSKEAHPVIRDHSFVPSAAY